MSINPMQRVCCCMPQLVDREESPRAFSRLQLSFDLDSWADYD